MWVIIWRELSMFHICFIEKPSKTESMMFEVTPAVIEESITPKVFFKALISARLCYPIDW